MGDLKLPYFCPLRKNISLLDAPPHFFLALSCLRLCSQHAADGDHMQDTYKLHDQQGSITPGTGKMLNGASIMIGSYIFLG
ncbi:hypothetical protein J6590_023539 [Homalodisca vitripennis]|nr:hypothetical protein J6590_023539 [Homalodisca vitripennis]